MSKMTSGATALVLVSGMTMAAIPALADRHEDPQLIELEKAAWEAWKNGDAEFFEENVADDGMLILGDGRLLSKADIVAETGGGACEVASYSLSNFNVHGVGAQAKILTYDAEQDAVCDGMKVPSNLKVSSTYVLREGKWTNVHYQETVRMEMEE